jgi:aminoglycoside phosphotransferase (APT) family kinase protein
MDRALARTLEPELRTSCAAMIGELDPVRWVRMDWQHGGAVTGLSRFTDEDGIERDVFVKFPVPGRELTWTRRLQCCGETPDAPVVPILYASGDTLGTHDIAWLVMELLPGLPMGAEWKPGNLAATARAGARLQACAQSVPADRPKKRQDWDKWLRQTKQSLNENHFEDRERWIDALDRIDRFWTSIITTWRSREPLSWIHGDLHMGNALARADGSVCLVDLAEFRPGHWLEDALYLERMYWSRPERIQQDDPVGTMARSRTELGLINGPCVEDLAMARRLLLAATTPAFLAHEGSRAHVAACLSTLEDGLEFWNAEHARTA